jgi:hypothetical protein
MRAARWVPAAALVALVVASCTSDGGSGAPSTSFEVPSADEAIAGFDQRQASLATSIALLTESALADPEAMREAALAELDATEPDRRFAAVLGLCLTASADPAASVDALVELSSSSDATERLLSAGALAAIGEERGVDVLIEALGSEEPMRGFDPPFAAWRYARANLLLLLGQDLGLRDAVDAASAAKAQAAWLAWWAENADALEWDPDAGRYVEAVSA